MTGLMVTSSTVAIRNYRKRRIKNAKKKINELQNSLWK